MFELRGAEQLIALSRRLKEIGAKDLEKELSRSITDAVKPLRDELKKSARNTLPRRGGLADRVARSRVTTRRSLRLNGQGIRVQAGGKKSQLNQMDEGRVRHPVYGNRKKWVTQSVNRGWWSRPVARLEDQVRDELAEGIRRVIKKVNR